MVRTIFMLFLMMCGNQLAIHAQSEGEVMELIQKKATFKGGEAALMKFITKKFVVPERYYKLSGGTELSIMVSFVVGKQGCIEDIRIVNADKIPRDLQEAAKDVFRAMGCKKWEPAVQRDKPVRMRFNIPIRVSIPAD